MNQSPDSPLTGRLTDSLLDSVAGCFDQATLEALANLRLDEAARRRLEVLAEKANEGQLTEEERQDYRAYIEFADVVSILQLRARHRLATAKPG